MAARSSSLSFAMFSCTSRTSATLRFAECGLGQQTIGGGTYAFTTYVGPFSQIGYAYELIGQRIMAHPHMAVFGASIEWYRTGSIDHETYLNQVDISFPIKARASDPRVLE